MVDEPREVAHLPLEDLVRSRATAAKHYVDALDAFCDKTREFTDGDATVEVLLVVG